MSIVFSCFSPHPPILLPSTGSLEERNQVKETIQSLKKQAEKLKQAQLDKILIFSPHPDWGFNVPLFFLAKDFKKEIEKILINQESALFCFEKGKQISQEIVCSDKRYGLIASGDLSHCLKNQAPYYFHRDGPEFDKQLIDCLKKKDIKRILKLDELYPQAGQCGLSCFCFVLGIMEGSAINYQPEILSYQSPFGVGYLVVNFKLRNN
jgi:aromatic ring-opening dioxygenase LigB subunit